MLMKNARAEERERKRSITYLEDELSFDALYALSTFEMKASLAQKVYAPEAEMRFSNTLHVC